MIPWQLALIFRPAIVPGSNLRVIMGRPLYPANVIHLLSRYRVHECNTLCKKSGQMSVNRKGTVTNDLDLKPMKASADADHSGHDRDHGHQDADQGGNCYDGMTRTRIAVCAIVSNEPH